MLASFLWKDIQDGLSTYAASCKIGEDGRWTFPATSQVMSFPIVGKRLIPGRLQNTVPTTFGTQFPFLELAAILSLFFNAEELEMNLFRLFVAAFMSRHWNSLLRTQEKLA
jgi:hypothetical protein